MLNGFFVFFHRVIPRTDVSVISCNIWIDLDRFINKLYLFLVVAYFTQSSSFEMIKLCLVSKFESLVAILDQFVPSFYQKQRICDDEIFLQTLVHFLSLLKYLVEFFLLLKLVDPLSKLCVFGISWWPAVFELL